MGPQDTPAGTPKLICVADREPIVAATPPTVMPLTSEKPLPLSVMLLPEAAVNDPALLTTTRGITVSVTAEVARSPLAASAATAPLCAAAGTSTVIDVLPTREATAACAPPVNSTNAARSSPVPVSVSGLPVSSDVADSAPTVIGASTVICCAVWRAVPLLSTRVR